MNTGYEYQMRPSRVLAKLRAGQIVYCYKLNLDSARAAEIAAMVGFDCLWTCMEHVPNDFDLIERQIWAAKGYDTDVLVRIARGSYSDYVRPLELDAAGIMVPHVMSAEDARRVVSMTRFHPVGRRPLDGGNADGKYCGLEVREYIRQANDQRFLVVQIEDPEPLEELDAIAGIRGIDVLFFGPGDFSHAIGMPGEMEHPRVLDARRRVAEAARRHGKYAATVGSPENLPELVDLGYRFINVGSDVIALGKDCRTLIQSFKNVRIHNEQNQK